MMWMFLLVLPELSGTYCINRNGFPFIFCVPAAKHKQPVLIFLTKAI